MTSQVAEYCVVSQTSINKDGLFGFTIYPGILKKLIGTQTTSLSKKHLPQ